MWTFACTYNFNMFIYFCFMYTFSTMCTLSPVFPYFCITTCASVCILPLSDCFLSHGIELGAKLTCLSTLILMLHTLRRHPWGWKCTAWPCVLSAARNLWSNHTAPIFLHYLLTDCMPKWIPVFMCWAHHLEAQCNCFSTLYQFIKIADTPLQNCQIKLPC